MLPFCDITSDIEDLTWYSLGCFWVGVLFKLILSPECYLCITGPKFHGPVKSTFQQSDLMLRLL